MLTADSALTATLEPVIGRPDLRAAAQPADYLIISHESFVPAMQSFAERRRADGHAVSVVDVQDIYDQFASGQREPAAIKRFIRHAACRWPASRLGPSASFVLLVGDATSAYRNEFRNDIINYVPSFAADSTYGASGNFASDAWFVQMFGNDALPDAAIGRFSVNNLHDLEAILEKQERYRSQSPPGIWENTLGFVADHNEFEEAVENIMARFVPPRFFIRRIFISEEPWVDNYYYPAEIADAKKAKVSPRSTAKIRDMFNDGAVFVTFFGHGSPNIWSNERVWFGGQSENSDNLMLTNRDRLAFILTMTCNSGAIDYPMPRWNVNISEDFMRVPNGGAVGCYVPSGQGVTSQHEQFAGDILHGLLVERAGTAIGPQLMLGAWRYLGRGASPDLVNMFILLGDPALPLRLSHTASDGTWQPMADGTTVALPPALVGRPKHVQYFAATVPSVAGPVLSVGTTEAAAALTPPALPPTAAVRAAVAAASRGQQRVESAGGWFLAPPVIALEQWRLEETRPQNGDSTNTLVLSLRSVAGGPLCRVRVSAHPAGNRAAPVESELFSLLPGEPREVRLPIIVPEGLTPWRLVVSAEGLPSHEIKSLKPLRTVGLRKDASAPPELDPDSVSVAAVAAESSVAVAVRFDVYNVAPQTLTGLTAALVGEDGAMLTGTLAEVPAVAPGSRARVELRRLLEADTPEHDRVRVRLDPFGRVAGSTNWPSLPVDAGRFVLPDLVIPPGGVVPSDPSPTDGETIFFDVTVANTGGSAIGGVRVEASERLADGAARLESRILRPPPTLDLDPGASAVVRLRWDPFRNAGERTLVFRAVAADANALERDTANNTLIMPLHVRTKHHLRAAGIHVPPPTAEELRERRLRIIARIENSGESPAHGVKVVFYPAGQRGKPGAALGETIIDTIPPGSFAEAQIIYRLRPGDEKKPYLKFTYEAFLKGSLQRVPFEG
ncbi:MAG: C25 family cysteine peptidase [Candidatus Sumerlaeaceae bacterium]|nr:C25 family cysteine peptidase [Candidatus Sumerlaeaceae bacterium]